MVLSANAQTDGFFRGGGEDYGDRMATGTAMPGLPHGGLGAGNDQTAPLGSGLIVLTALGAGYAGLRKRNN